MMIITYLVIIHWVPHKRPHTCHDYSQFYWQGDVSLTPFTAEDLSNVRIWTLLTFESMAFIAHESSPCVGLETKEGSAPAHGVCAKEEMCNKLCQMLVQRDLIKLYKHRISK
jgi:hypothetical protein